MDAIFMNSKNSKTSSPHRLSLNLSDKINLKSSDKYVALSRKNIQKSYRNDKFKISVPTWNEGFELPDGWYSVSGIRDNFKCIIKKHQNVTDNPPIRKYVNKIENKITFKIKIGYYFELLTTETWKH